MYKLINTTTCIGLSLFAFNSYSLFAKEKKQKLPNIVFILTDDQRADVLGYAGNKLIQTPEMDKLASTGVYFQNAFATTPISAASRASILTGLYERTTGYTFEQGDLKKPYMDIAYPVVLRQNGYYTGFFGKLGVEYKDAKTLFDRADIYDRDNRMKDRRGYFYKTIGKDTVHLTRFTGYEAQEFIKNAPADKPFCLSLSFSAPHAHDNAPEQYFWQEKSNSRYNNIVFPSAEMSEGNYFNALPKEVKEGFNRTRWFWTYDTPEKYQRSIKGYYRMITEVDDEIGEIRKLLKAKGLDDNTVIIFMGDNGLFKGERQLAGKWLMYDLSIGIPMIIYDPRVNKHNVVSDMVLNIDIPKTILSLAKVKVPTNYQGMNLMSYLTNNRPEKPRASILIEHLWSLPQIPSSEGLRTTEWKYFRYRLIKAPEELYNIKKDPMEKENLAQNPKYKKILDQLRRECDAKIQEYVAAKLCPDTIISGGHSGGW